MNEAAFLRFAGWTAYFNSAVFLFSLVALILFFSLGGFWGPLNDSLSVVWVLSFIPLAVALYLVNRTVNVPMSLVSSIIGITAAVVFAILQTMLVLGQVRFEQTYSTILVLTAVIGLFVAAHAFLAYTGRTLPTGLIWVMIAYGVASVIGALGFQIGGQQHPLSMVGLLLTAVSGLIWVIWFARLLLGEKIAVALVSSS